MFCWLRAGFSIALMRAFREQREFLRCLPLQQRLLCQVPNDAAPMCLDCCVRHGNCTANGSGAQSDTNHSEVKRQGGPESPMPALESVSPEQQPTAAHLPPRELLASPGGAQPTALGCTS